jgi:SAM-dependent methyltransferase
MTASVEYLDRVAGTVARDYKNELLTALRLQAGHAVLDLGCGPGTDLASLAAAVGATGSVIGVDHDPVMVATARQRLADHPTVEIRVGDAHRLPLEAGSGARARVDRVLMHVESPAAVLTEVLRVLRPGGLLALAEPDWDTLAVDHPALEISRAFTAFVAQRINRNHAVGRQLARLAVGAGFTVLAARNAALVLNDFEAADAVLGLTRNTRRAVEAGYLSAHAAEVWLGHLRTEAFFATASFITVLAQSPARG